MNLDEYEISGKILGQGSFGIVGEAILRRTGEFHAVKIIEKKNVASQDFANLKIESDILRKMNHPHILRFHGYFEDSLRLYLFTEIIQGGELFDRMIENNGFHEKEAQTISRKLFGAVNFCHRNGIVHRDIKAENVLLVSNKSDYDLRLIDFGFAVEAEGITLKGELGID
jgi:serine/threonine protein kinase